MTNQLREGFGPSGFIGVLAALVAGFLIGAGQLRGLAIALALLLALILLILGVRALTLAPERTGFWLFAIAVLCVTWSGVRATGSVTFADLFLLLAAPFALVCYLGSSTKFKFPTWLVVGTGLLAASTIILEILPDAEFVTNASSTTTYFSFQEAAGSNLSMGIRLIIALSFLPTMAVYIIRTWGSVSTLVSVWIIGVCVSCLVAVLDFFMGLGLQTALGGADLREGAFGSDQYGVSGADVRYVGLTFHPVALSLSASMAIPLVLARMTKSASSALVYAPALMLLLAGSLLSGSRTGIVLFVAVLLAFLFWGPRYRRPVIWLAALAALIYVLNVAGLPILPERLSSGSDVELSNQVRIDNLREALSGFLDRPILGYGYEYSRQAHNIVLQLLVSGGLIALIGYFTVTIGYLKSGIQLASRVPAWIRPDLIGSTTAFVVFLVSGLFSNSIFERYLYIPAAVVLAAVAIMSGVDAQRSTRER